MRNEIKDAYLSEAKLRIYKHNMQSRFEKRDFSRVFRAVTGYAWKFLFLWTNDKVLFDYKRKLKKEVQWTLLTNQLWPCIFGSFFYTVTRMLKKRSSLDIFYFLVPYAYMNFSIYLSAQRTLFEKGFPAHPFV